MESWRGRWVWAVWLGGLALCPGLAWSWGFPAHQLVVANAIDLLPAGLKSILDADPGALRKAVLEPDTQFRNEFGAEEAVRHYLNLDLLGEFPFAAIPRDFDAAVERFGSRKMNRAGRLPWRVEDLQRLLTRDFRRGDWKQAIVRAGHLAHYLADATQPLHATLNFDGQNSCNRGIHNAFERQLIDRDIPGFTRSARQRQEPARYLDRPLDEVFRILVEAYPLSEEILTADGEAMELVKKGKGVYFDLLDSRLREVAVRQLALAGTTVASFWLTAWIDSGRGEVPDPD